MLPGKPEHVSEVPNRHRTRVDCFSMAKALEGAREIPLAGVRQSGPPQRIHLLGSNVERPPPGVNRLIQPSRAPKQHRQADVTDMRNRIESARAPRLHTILT